MKEYQTRLGLKIPPKDGFSLRDGISEKPLPKEDLPQETRTECLKSLNSSVDPRGSLGLEIPLL